MRLPRRTNSAVRWGFPRGRLTATAFEDLIDRRIYLIKVACVCDLENALPLACERISKIRFVRVGQDQARNVGVQLCETIAEKLPENRLFLHGAMIVRR